MIASLKIRRLVVVVALCALGVVAVVTGYTVATGQSPLGSGDTVQGPTEQDIEYIVTADYGFPDVVATVNGHQITGSQLTYAVAARIAGGAPQTTDLAASVLADLVDLELLVQAGQERGLAPDDREVQEYLLKTVGPILALPSDSPQRMAANRLADEFGYDLANPAGSDLLMEYGRRQLTAARVRNEIEGEAGLGAASDPDDSAAAVSAFLESYRAGKEVEVVYDP
jgi:hypothetical protein